MTGSESDAPGLARPELVRVLESAARLQEVVPDAVLVGGSAAAPWANHRFSHDHDHVLQDLSDHFDAVLEAIEATDGWVTNRVTPGKIILSELGDIESGVRQLIRKALGGHGSGASVRTRAPDPDARRDAADQGLPHCPA
jgi:hypothetical protein